MRDIILITFFALLWVKNTYGLKLALQFLHDVKENAYVKCPAKIIWAFGTSANAGFSRKYAIASYKVEGKQIHSIMICVCNFKIKKGDRLDIIFPKSNPKIFAFSKQHVKDAVLTYGVLTAVFALLSIGMTVIYLLTYFEQ